MAGPRRRRSRPPRERTVNLDRYSSVVPDWSDFLEAASRPEPTVFRVRTGRIAPDALRARLEEQGYRVRPLDGMPSFFQVEDGPRPVSFTLEHWAGLIYVQQASTGVAAPALAPEPGERVLDLCSAPGGKTTHAADLMDDRGTLVAADVSEGRIRGLLGNVYRLGHPNIMVVAADGRDFPEDACFDRVLVDAPCSGEGTLRRRGGQPPDQSRRFLDYVTRIQEVLLRKAIRITRPGGTILYVTCTFAPEENEAVVSRVLQDAPVELEPLTLPVAHAPGLTAFGDLRFDPRLEGAARIYPHHLDSGGLFLARLRKLDDGTAVNDGAWGPVPTVFADDGMEVDGMEADGMEADGPVGGDSVTPVDAEAMVAKALASLQGHFGVDPAAFDGLSWLARGGRLWLHALTEWPVAGWTHTGKWRVVSTGFRAMEFDTLGRARPTNDVLQWLGARVRERRVDLTDGQLLHLLGGDPLPWRDQLEGLQALFHHGVVAGRGVPTVDGLRSEVSKAQARDLMAIIERKGTPTPSPADD